MHLDWIQSCLRKTYFKKTAKSERASFGHPSAGRAPSMQLKKLGGREVSARMNFLRINNACYTILGVEPSQLPVLVINSSVSGTRTISRLSPITMRLT